MSSGATVTVVGAGVAGLTTALELSERGIAVEVIERGQSVGAGCSRMAGGMLAPWCERAATDEAVMRLGAPSIEWWLRHYPGTVRDGSLVVAPPRDAAELTRFAARTEAFEWRDEAGIAALEPDLAGRFRRALFFPREAHLEPRPALPGLAGALAKRGVALRLAWGRP